MDIISVKSHVEGKWHKGRHGDCWKVAVARDANTLLKQGDGHSQMELVDYWGFGSILNWCGILEGLLIRES